MKLVAYARYSSDNQREESITAQLRAITKWANDNGHIIVKEYIDEALSARTDNRPNFLQMIEDSKSANWDGVVVHKLDRFSRNRYNSAIYKKILKSTGKRLYSVLEKLDDSPESIIMESLLEGMNEYYSANLAREVKKGLKENALACKHNGGIPPLGYDVNKDKYYIINEQEAKIVRTIFSLIMNDYTYPDICRELKKLNYKTKTGKDFKPNSIHDILRNEKYTGVYIFGYGNRAKSRNKPNENVIKIEDGMPQIIDKETFENVQKKLKGRKHMGGSYRAKQTYILTGLIQCGKCGCNYVGSAKSPTRVVYECSGKRTGSCDNSYIKKETIESMVLNAISNIFADETKLNDIVDKVNTLYKELYNNSENDKKVAVKELAEINKKIKNINTAIMNGFYNTSMNEEAKKLELEKELVEERISMIENVSKKSKITLDDLKALLYKDLVSIESLNLNELKRIIPKYIKKITLNDETIDIKLFFDTGNCPLLAGDTRGGGEACHSLSPTISISFDCIIKRYT